MPVRQLLRSLLSRPDPAPPEAPPEGAPERFAITTIAPGRAVYAIGDIHGRADLIEPLLLRIEADIRAQGQEHAQLVFLGDYVDRGEQSAQVLDYLHALSCDLAGMVTCLLGNHERMMLDFLDDPAGRGARWLANGGLQTLASYGIGGLGARASVDDMAEASDALAAALPRGREAWLRARPLHWQSGNVVCVHAAMNPARRPDDQDERALLWGHRDFMSTPRADGLWVVHGHTSVREPELSAGRIAIDTGAWHSGRLSAAALTPGMCRFL